MQPHARVIFSYVASPAPQHSSKLSHKLYNFRKEKHIELEMRVLFSAQLLSETSLILRRIQVDIINVFM